MEKMRFLRGKFDIFCFLSLLYRCRKTFARQNSWSRWCACTFVCSSSLGWHLPPRIGSCRTIGWCWILARSCRSATWVSWWNWQWSCNRNKSFFGKKSCDFTIWILFFEDVIPSCVAIASICGTSCATPFAATIRIIGFNPPVNRRNAAKWSWKTCAAKRCSRIAKMRRTGTSISCMHNGSSEMPFLFKKKLNFIWIYLSRFQLRKKIKK